MYAQHVVLTTVVYSKLCAVRYNIFTDLYRVQQNSQFKNRFHGLAFLRFLFFFFVCVVSFSKPLAIGRVEFREINLVQFTIDFASAQYYSTYLYCILLLVCRVFVFLLYVVDYIHKQLIVTVIFIVIIEFFERSVI